VANKLSKPITDLFNAESQLAIASWTIKILREREKDPVKVQNLRYVESCVAQSAAYMAALRAKVSALPKKHQKAFAVFTEKELSDGLIEATQLALEDTHLQEDAINGVPPAKH